MNLLIAIKRLFNREMTAVLDPEDGSITLNKRLFDRMDKDCHGSLEDVYVFQINGEHGNTYGWTCNPRKTIFKDDDKDVNRPLAQVQYNTKTNTIGFMPTNPTLALMYYNLNLVGVKHKVTIGRHKASGITYYQIEL